MSGRLTYTEDEQPIVAYIWGDKPEYFHQMSIGMAEEGFKGIDLIMGLSCSECSREGEGKRPDLPSRTCSGDYPGG